MLTYLQCCISGAAAPVSLSLVRGADGGLWQVLGLLKAASTSNFTVEVQFPARDLQPRQGGTAKHIGNAGGADCGK